MKLKHIFLIIIASITLVACQNENTSMNTDDIKALIHQYSIGEFTDQQASITGTELIVTLDDGGQMLYNLPENEFFVSFAPFIDHTHPCTYHSLTGCQSELVEQELDVYIEDEEGNVFLDEKLTTLENGFIDLWLPREQTFHITVDYQGKSAEAEISTFDNDPTCITTMHLS